MTIRSHLSRGSDRTMNRHIALGTLMAGLAGCAPDGGSGIAPSVPASIALSPDSSVLWDGDTLRFSATVFDSRGQVLPRAQVLWTSGPSPEITIDVTGLATASRVGPSPDTVTVSISAS